MDGIRHLSRWMPSVIAAALFIAAPASAVLARPAPWVAHTAGVSVAEQSALADPPDVRGLTVSDAQKLLRDWNKNVVIQLVPQQLPAGVNESTVVVATSTLLNSPQTPAGSAIRPVVRLTLGSRVPDLTGMTSAAAAQALAARGLRLGRPSQPTEPNWVVSAQQVPPGSIVEFGVTVAATFAAPGTAPPTIVLVGVAGLVLLLLALATSLGIRASRRRARRRRDRQAAAVRLEAHPGQVVGPDLTERTSTVSVRLAPHHDPGTVSMEEVRR